MKNFGELMLVTLMTDASHCSETGAGGFGFWCVCERGKLAGGDMLKGFIADSYEAEMKGVANSLQTAINNGLILPRDTVLIQLDNLGVIDAIRGKWTRKNVQYIVDYILSTAKNNRLKLICKHVKGHSKQEGNRFLANNHCDKKAKEMMRKRREEINQARTDESTELHLN